MSGASSAEEVVIHHSHPEGIREKQVAAMSSVVAAIFLTTMKIVVGILTGSLGILAEAAHSALDLVAAAVTFISVRLSSRPADQNHTYGHGKIENLSALFETVLLLVTCVWIIYEAVSRLFFKHVEVEASIWSFVVMSISIVVDVSRSRMLTRVAKKYDSQALEADALHFSTDIWSSAVVILGLALIVISKWLNIPWLAQADAVAAMGVAGIVVYVSLQLGRKAIGDLLDEVPGSLQEQVKAAAHVSSVQSVRQVRVRRSGPDYFVDLNLEVNRAASSDQAHDATEEAERAVKQLLPGAIVLVHVDPVQTEDEKLEESLRVLAGKFGLGVHHVHVREVDGKRILLLHVDVRDDLPLEVAHERATQLEDAVFANCENVDQVWTHLEPVYRDELTLLESAFYRDTNAERIIQDLPAVTGLDCGIHSIMLLEQAGKLTVSFHCTMKGSLPVHNAHEVTERLEAALMAQLPNLGHVLIHVEPSPDA